MKETKKFQIYYEPIIKDSLVSFTLSFSRINESDDTYKLKLIKEVKRNSIQSKTYKVKEFHFNANEILDKLDKIDFTEKFDKYQSDKDMYFIQYENEKIITNNKTQIQYILDLFDFDDLININENQYEYVKDVYEFIKLHKLFIERIKKIKSTVTIEKLFDYYLNQNPYKIFENLNDLESFKIA